MRHSTVMGRRWFAAAILLAAPPAVAGTCDPDLDGSGDVGTADLLALLSAWGQTGVPEDLNGDGVVNVFDLVLLLDCWGPCPCPPLGNSEAFTETVSVDVTDASTPPGLIVSHLYATGPGVNVGDTLLAAGLASITPMNTIFHQDPLGGDTPPASALCSVFPDLCYDTFVTMNLLTDDTGQVFLAPSFSMSASAISGAWFGDPNSTIREAVDISALTGNPGQAGVLIAQITLVAPPGPSSVGYTGTVTLWASSAAGGTGEGSTSETAFAPDCPWDCEPVRDGAVGILDWLEVLAQWNQVGTSCDFVGDLDGVGILEWLAVLEHWGPCL